jgi:hypothetical protein
MAEGLGLIGSVAGIANSDKLAQNAAPWIPIPTGNIVQGGPGGISPQQAALAEYTMQQGELLQRNTAGTQGIGASTMATQMASGPVTGAAVQSAKLSDANQQAQYQELQTINQAQSQAAAAEVQAHNQAASAFDQNAQNLVQQTSQTSGFESTQPSGGNFDSATNTTGN